jgi:hypothetical protein
MARKARIQKVTGAAGELLSLAQAGREIGMTRQGVSYAVKRGYLQAVRVGPYRLIPRQSVETYQKARPRSGPAKGRKLGRHKY